ncbi:MAG: class I SAM-dependent methyltransferase [Candidatus Thorarchaeota archaeon]
MLAKIGAWREVMKLGLDARKRTRELREFYRANSVKVLRREGWFDFMTVPRTVGDIVEHFGYTDVDFLVKYLDALADDDILVRQDGTYRTNGVVEDYPIVPPDIFGPGLVQITADAAASIPERLKGRYGTFSDEMNVFNWDDTLGLKMYEQIRRAAFKFSGALKKRGRFIDVGCGSGISTAAIWGYYYTEGAFDSDPPVEIHALEFDPNLKQIAEDEFVVNAARLLGVDRKVVEDLEDHHPVFVQGTAENLPYEDAFFDMTYTSQVLHWCDAERATREMMRVLKPGGLFFGTEAFHPTMDSYTELFIMINEGAYGTIKKEDFFRWVRESGASDAKSVTPAGVFKVVKKK